MEGVAGKEQKDWFGLNCAVQGLMGIVVTADTVREGLFFENVIILLLIQAREEMEATM